MELAVGYIRVSTDIQDNSLEMQKQRIADYCRFKGIRITKFFIDEDVSGGKPLSQRPAGAKLVEALSKGKVTNIVALKLDRVFRNTVDALTMAEQWNKEKVSFHLVDQGGQAVDTSTSVGWLIYTQLVSFAEFERKQISERTSKVLSYKKESSMVYSGPIFGFTRDGDYLKVNSEEMKVVKMIHEWRNGGDSLQHIADCLNLKQVQTKKGGIWHPSTIGKILKNSIYSKHLTH
jgi:site-specific DNA recombinase